jgi:glycogen operon protein
MLRESAFYTDAEIQWFGPQGTTPAWAEPRRKSFACRIFGPSDDELFLMFNADTAPADFSIPTARSNKVWRLAADTSRLAPDDLYEPGKEPSMQGQISFRVEPRSSAILLARG